MRKLMIAVLGTFVGFVGQAVAHDGHDHGVKVAGTVIAVHADKNHVQVKTVKGETAEFYVNANTKYLKGKTALALSALKPGTRVVADVKTVNDAPVASLVRVGAAGKAPAAAAAAPHH